MDALAPAPAPRARLRAQAGNGVLQPQRVEGSDFQQPAQLDGGAQSIELVRTGERPFASATEPAKTAGLSGFLVMLGGVPEAHVLATQRRRVA
ncbi:MAG: hypothetical protein FJX76_26960 [Armatimonadetes bacterium]|nr:hypothetical protein [Armatimonadota bacterium]